MKEKKRIKEDVIMEAEVRVIHCEQNLINLKKKEQGHQTENTDSLSKLEKARKCPLT